jgi:hypothetical protein
MGWIVPPSAGTYRVNCRDPAGKQRARTLRTKREAKAFLAQVEAAASRGSYVDPHAGRRVLLRDFAEDWLAGRTVEATTDERTRSILRTHVLPQWEPGRWSESITYRCSGGCASWPAGWHQRRSRRRSTYCR